MKSYTFYAPTMFFFGRGCLQEKTEVLKSFGKKAFLVTSPFPVGTKNLALEDAKRVLEDMGMSYLTTEEVEENPPIRTIVSMTQKAREFDPDFIIGVGGGSSIDSAKAISVLLDYPAENDNVADATRIFYDGTLPHEALWSEGKCPVLAIPTTAGTGAEVTAFAVLTNEETHVKQAMSQPVFCKAAFLDGRYLEGSPSLIIHTGAMDALAHGAESYVNKKGEPMNRRVAEIGFRLFSEFKDDMLNDCMTAEDYDKQMMFANIMGMAFMRSGTAIPHGMGYALSTFKGVNHGLSCSVTLGEYLKCFREEENIGRAEHIAELCGFDDLDDMAAYISEIISRDLHITVTEQELDTWTNDFFNQKWRLVKHPEELNVELIRRIYYKSLKNYLVK